MTRAKDISKLITAPVFSGLTYPTSDGSSNQFMKTDGSGTLSFATVTSTAINNNANNRIITGSGTANTLEGEANLTFDGTTLGLTGNLTVSGAFTSQGIDDNANAVAITIDSSEDITITKQGTNTTDLRFANSTNSFGGNIKYDHNSGIMMIHTHNAERMRIDASGNVGIGATSVTNGKLLLLGSNGTVGGVPALARFAKNGSGGGAIESGDDNAQIQIGSDGTNGFISTGNNALRYLVNSAERMRIDSSGRVGIGTTNNGDYHANVDDLVIAGTGSRGITIASQSGHQSAIAFADGTGDNTTEVQGRILYNHNGDTMNFYTNGVNERMRIDSSGRVGIGTTTVTTELDVRGTGQVEIGIGSTNGGGAMLVLDGDSNGDYNGSDYSYIHHVYDGRLDIFQDSPSGTNEIRFYTNATERMRLNASGQLSIPNQPSFQGSSGMFSTTGQAIVASSVYHNIGNHYNTSNGTFTAPVTGRYLINFFAISNGASTMDVELRINGTVSNQFAPYSTSSGQHTHVSGSCIAAVSANDTLKLILNNGSIYGGSNGRHNGQSFHLLS